MGLFLSVHVGPAGRTHQNTLCSILTFTHIEFKTTGKWMQGEPVECYIKAGGWREGRGGGGGGEMDLHFKTTWWRPLWTDPSLSLFLSVSLSASLSHAPFLSRSDRFIKRQGSKRVPSSLLSSSLAFSSSSSTDSISSLVSPSLSPRPVARACILEPAEKNERNRGWGRRWGGGGDRRRRGWISFFFFFPSLWPALKDSFPLSLSLSLSHTHTLVTFSPFPHMKLSFSIIFSTVCTFSKLFFFWGGVCRGIKTVCHREWRVCAYSGECYLSICLHWCTALHSKPMACQRKHPNADRWGYFSIAIFLQWCFPSL